MPLDPPPPSPSFLVRTPVRGKIISAPLTATAVDTARGRYMRSSRASRSSLASIYTTRSVAQSLSSTLKGADSDSVPEDASPSSESSESNSTSPGTPRAVDIFEPRPFPSPGHGYAFRPLPASIAEEVFEPRPHVAQGIGSEEPFALTSFISEWPAKPRAPQRTISLDGNRPRPLPFATRREAMIVVRPSPATPLEANGIFGQMSGISHEDDFRQLCPLSPVQEVFPDRIAFEHSGWI
ncbi:hypothetical protein K439DRAFT_1632252 [Ramaria rubella]|nr:hypothetical protein K439DRAFT_1632252 [Ramaria rubella]